MPGNQNVRAEPDNDNTKLGVSVHTPWFAEEIVPDPVHVVFRDRHDGREAKKNIDASNPYTRYDVYGQPPYSQIEGPFRQYLVSPSPS
jgi:hypothetical protein